jgi:hypothetical protein
VVGSKLDGAFCESGLPPQIAAEADVMSTALLAVEVGVGGAVSVQGRLFRRASYANQSAARIDPAIELTASMLWLAEEPLTPLLSEDNALISPCATTERFYRLREPTL